MGRRSKPIITHAELKGEKVINLLKSKYELKQKRTALVKEAQVIRKKVYNLSREINELEANIDLIILQDYTKK